MTKPKDYQCDVHRMCYVGQGSLIIWTIRCHLVISGDYMRSLIGCWPLVDSRAVVWFISSR